MGGRGRPPKSVAAAAEEEIDHHLTQIPSVCTRFLAEVEKREEEERKRVESYDGQLWRPRGRSGQNRGFYGGGKSGSGGGAGHPPFSSYVNQASLSGNQSFKKSGNGQGGQPRINPASLGFETSVATSTPRAVQNGEEGHPSSQEYFLEWERMNVPLPKSPLPRSSSGEGTKPSAVQFGEICPGIANVIRIPARTSSAPPNLDEQKRDQHGECDHFSSTIRRLRELAES